MCNNLYEALCKTHGENPEMDPGEQYVKQLCDNLQGKVVELVFYHGDAFEKVDDNVWFPHTLWAPVPIETPVEAVGCEDTRKAYSEWLMTRNFT